jgi:hypothetical protein
VFGLQIQNLSLEQDAVYLLYQVHKRFKQRTQQGKVDPEDCNAYEGGALGTVTGNLFAKFKLMPTGLVQYMRSDIRPK